MEATIEATIDNSLVARAIDFKSSVSKLRTLLNVDGESNVPQWAKDRMQELDEHLKEEKFIRSKQEESYDALSKYNKELTEQIETLAKSRDALEEKLHRSEDAVYLEKKLSENKENKWKQEKRQLELQDSQKQAKIETLTARNGYYQKENEDFKNDHRRAKEVQKEVDALKEELKKKQGNNEAMKKEMGEKQAASEERYKQEVQKREDTEKRLVDMEATVHQELKETKSKLEKAEEEMDAAAKSLASFLVVIKETIGDKEDDDDNEDVDLSLESNVSNIGVALENMQSIVADSQDTTDELKRELEEVRNKWHESRGELMDLKEDYAELEEQLKGLEDKTDSKPSIADDKDEAQSYDSRDEKEDEVEPMEEEPDRSQNDNEIASTEKELPNAPQNDYESDVQPPSNSPAKIPIEEDKVVPDRDDDPTEDAASDKEEVQPATEANSVKRPLEEEEEASYHADDSNEGGREQLAPAVKRAKIDEGSDGEGSAESVSYNIDNLNKEAALDIEEGENHEAPIVKIASIDEDSNDDGSGLYEC